MQSPSLHHLDPDAAPTERQKPALRVLLTNPRGFCAGVDRAIEIVEKALLKFGPPVYVRHEIVHNRFVVESLQAKGAIFVDELDQVPDNAPVIFSAHGVPKSVPEEAQQRRMLFVDATCPLVSKVHREAERHDREKRQVILIGHRGHPEVIGTMGQLADNTMLLVETAADVAGLTVADPTKLAYVTQTTLSLADTADVIQALKERFPAIKSPKKEDICYATTNRQRAVQEIAAQCDALLVVGAPNSSNSQRLVEVAERAGCPLSILVQRATDIPWARLSGIATVGLTAGASAPEILVAEVIDAFHARYQVTVNHATTAEENVHFKLPRLLDDAVDNEG
jgi:4-hydroxy-3-methylbut-2-enyl diphosphate reductase